MQVEAFGSIGPIGGLRIVDSEFLTIGPFEDWTGVRSHGRAARRLKRGFRQNIRYFRKPDPNMRQLSDGTLVGHPETVALLRRELARNA